MIIGNPEKFNGKGLVAFIDILGFSKEIENNWNNKDENPLEKLLELKKHLPKYSNKDLKKLDPESKTKRTYICRVQTISDSIVVSFGFEEKIIMGDLMLGMSAFFNTISVIWRNAIETGFTVRGAVDFGSIYWDKTEIIGPAFINAYRLEQSYAKTSRIVLSSVFNGHLGNVYNKERTLWDEHALNFLRKDNDGYIIINPHNLYNSDEDKIRVIELLKAMQKKARSLDREKYVPVLAALNSEKYNLKKEDVGNY